MRELKFRIFYQHDETGQITLSYMLLGQPIPALGERWAVINKCQFTGLLDKNGREIYEGDIVTIDAGYSGDNWYEKSIAKIIYEGNEFYPENPHDNHGVTYQDNPWHGMEIIGNIHENPELLSQGE